MAKMNFGKYSFETSNLNKIFFPGEGYTKGDLINYYNKIADKMLPHLKNRPVSMLRYPDGIKGENFFQKDAPDYFPDWIEKIKVKKEDGTVNHVVCNKKAALVYLAGQACITPHVWLSRKDRINYPDRLIFDLDPSDNDFSSVRFAAKKLGEFLNKELKLPVFFMTTGSKGIHVVVPINRKNNFDEVRIFAQDTAKLLVGRYPDKLTTKVRKNQRGKKVFLDTARNAYAQTAVPPYSVRAKKSAPVAAPIEWEELSNNKLHAQSYNIQNIFKRLSTKKNLWKDIDRKKASINKAVKLLKQIYEQEINK